MIAARLHCPLIALRACGFPPCRPTKPGYVLLFERGRHLSARLAYLHAHLVASGGVRLPTGKQPETRGFQDSLNKVRSWFGSRCVSRFPEGWRAGTQGKARAGPSQ